MAGGLMRAGGCRAPAARGMALLALTLASACFAGPVHGGVPVGSPRPVKSPTPASPRRLPPPPPTTLTIRGRVVYKYAPGKSLWSLSSTSLAFYKLPGQPKDVAGNLVPPQTVVILKCTLAADDPTRCVQISDTRLSVAAPPLVAAGQVLRLMVAVVSFSATGACGARAGAPVSLVQTTFNTSDGYISFLQSCSYGKMVYDTKSLTVVSTPLYCSSAINRCDEDAIATAARRYLSSAGYTNFTHFSFVLPLGMAATCGWSSLAELPGTQTWFQPDSKGFFDKGTFLRGTLNNFGLYGSWRSGVEQGDGSTCMGFGDSCPSAPELWRLGWASPADLLNASSLPARVVRSYSLPATFLGPDRVYVKIQTDWLGPSSYRKNVYLALRMDSGGDGDLLPEFDMKLSIHEGDRTFDTMVGAAGDPQYNLVGTMTPFSSRDLSSYRLYIRTEALAGTRITVRVCRYTSTSSECGDSGLPSPPPPLRRPPSPPLVRSPPSPPSPSPPPPIPSPRRPMSPQRPPPPPKAKPPPPPPDDYVYLPPPGWEPPPPYWY